MDKKILSVLFIMHMPPPVHGASMVGKLIRDSKVINGAFEGHYINLTTADSLADIGKVGFKKGMAFVRLLHTIQQEIRRVKPDVVYVTPNSAGGAFYKDFVVVETVRRTLGKVNKKGRVVLHFHNKGVKMRQENRLDDLLYRRFFKGVKVILLAEALYGDVAKYVKREDVVFCGNGIPDFPLENVAKDHGVPRLLFLSNMMATKGVWELLDALAVLRGKGIRFCCDFVGGWKDVRPEEFGRRVEAYGLDSCVCAHGAKYGMDKEVFFEQADIFVLPSYTEAFPLTVLEAMQHGLAVVASNVGGMSGLVADGVTGRLIGGNEPILTMDYRPDPQELASVLEDIIVNRELCRTMGKGGGRRFKEEFTLQAFERKFVDSLRWVAGR